MQVAYKFYKVNNIKLHVYHAGMDNEKIMVLLHGFPEFHYGWENQVKFFVQQGYHVVVPDQRGYGESNKPNGVKSYALDILAQDIVQLVKQITNDRVILVGHDWGGGVAWTLGQHYADLIEKLVILNMPHIQVMKETLKNNPEQRKKSWYAAFFQIPFLPEFLIKLSNYKFLEMSLKKSSNEGTFSELDLKTYKNAWQKPNSLTSMINWYRAFLYNKLDVNKDINIPTKIIWGARDSALSLQMAYDSKEKCTDGSLTVLDDLTHWLHHEDPDRVNGLLLNFLKETK